jgi:hypothetical protein
MFSIESEIEPSDDVFEPDILVEFNIFEVDEI